MDITRMRDLLNDMSLKEKIGQMTQVDAGSLKKQGSVTGPTEQLGVDEEGLFLAGSILGADGAAEIKELQDRFMAKQPHGIPLLFMADIINGYKTVFPIPLALGCSFSEEAVRVTGEVMSKESYAAGLHVTFAPMVDLVRDARWGRVMESTGEDPYLNAVMAGAMVRGIQGDSGHYEGRIAACTKHFAAYGAPIAGKEYNNVELSARTLYDDYLPSYRAAIDAGSAMVMTAFNTLDRIPVTGNRWLLRDVLRQEFGFAGVLVSDYAAIGELVSHGFAEDKGQAARLALKAGVDLDMMSGCFMAELERMVETEPDMGALIDEAVWRILLLKNQLGLFEDPYRNADPATEQAGLHRAEFREKAREVAADTMVLLKNDGGFWPLGKSERTVFIGPYVDEKNILGAWSFFGDPADSVTIKEGVTAKTDRCVFASGCEVVNPGEAIYGFRYHVQSALSEEETERLIEEAVGLARTADKVVMALGEANIQTGEGGSRGDITIPERQKELFARIYEVNRNIGVVLFAGRPLDIRDIAKKAKGVLYAWMPGHEGGNAVADILYGDKVPQGKLAMSMPYCVGQVPVFYGEFHTGRRTVDGGDVRNRFLAKYSDIPNRPLYPFGFGLSYTDFAISEVSLSKDAIAMDESLVAEVEVTNTGEREGVETVQLYITDKVGSVVRPVRELKGFEKVFLKAGESKIVRFVIDAGMLKFHNIDMGYTAEKGRFVVWVGADCETGNGKEFVLG